MSGDSLKAACLGKFLAFDKKWTQQPATVRPYLFPLLYRAIEYINFMPSLVKNEDQR